MIHYFKEVTGVTFRPLKEINLKDSYDLEVYTMPGQKYKVWHPCLPFFNRKIATQRLWYYNYHSMVSETELYTDKEIGEKYHLIFKEDWLVFKKATVVLRFSDGEEKCLFFDENEPAEKFIKEIVDKYNLTLDKY